MATFVSGEEQCSVTGIISDPQSKRLTDLPSELLEYILCAPVLQHTDICNVSSCCKRLHDVCHGRGKVWEHQYKLRCLYSICDVTSILDFCRNSDLNSNSSLLMCLNV